MMHAVVDNLLLISFYIEACEPLTEEIGTCLLLTNPKKNDIFPISSPVATHINYIHSILKVSIEPSAPNPLSR